MNSIIGGMAVYCSKDPKFPTKAIRATVLHCEYTPFGFRLILELVDFDKGAIWIRDPEDVRINREKCDMNRKLEIGFRHRAI